MVPQEKTESLFELHVRNPEIQGNSYVTYTIETKVCYTVFSYECVTYYRIDDTFFIQKPRNGGETKI